LDEAKLDLKAGNNSFFFGNRHDWAKPHNWSDFFCQWTFFEVLGKSVARGWAQDARSSIKLLF